MSNATDNVDTLRRSSSTMAMEILGDGVDVAEESKELLTVDPKGYLNVFSPVDMVSLAQPTQTLPMDIREEGQVSSPPTRAFEQSQLIETSLVVSREKIQRFSSLVRASRQLESVQGMGEGAANSKCMLQLIHREAELEPEPLRTLAPLVSLEGLPSDWVIQKVKDL